MAIYYTGGSGKSTGPHLDFRVFNPQTGSYEDPSSYTSYLTVGDKPFEYDITSGYQPEGRVHPVDGTIQPHDGIDYATPSGTAISIKGGQHLSTWDDERGGRMSQFYVDTENGPREFIMLHGNDQNKVTGTSALTDYDINNFTNGNKPAPASNSDTPKKTAKEKAKAYKEMSKAEMNAAYDAMRDDPNKAAREGMKMHKAYFNKP